MINPIKLEIVTIPFLNKCIGRIGLDTISSTTTNIMADTSVAARSPRICDEPHSYCVPAHENASRRGTIVVVKNNEPK
ncbi:hypothetical protein D3C73_1349750 [compost metagenome]